MHDKCYDHSVDRERYPCNFSPFLCPQSGAHSPPFASQLPPLTVQVMQWRRSFDYAPPPLPAKGLREVCLNDVRYRVSNTQAAAVPSQLTRDP
eukprot:2866301-Pleurochrysis_carterae.AAC.2